jgi:hypothetical protein
MESGAKSQTLTGFREFNGLKMHSLICGITESGKTTLGKHLASIHRKQGFHIHVLTSVWDAWDADFLTDDKDEFLKAFWESRSLIVFVDEGGETVGRYDETMKATATRGRHYGHSCYYIVQASREINPTIREQCTQLFLFNCGRKTAETLAEDWNQPELANAPSLLKGEYYRCLRFGADGKPFISKGNAFIENKPEKLLDTDPKDGGKI